MLDGSITDQDSVMDRNTQHDDYRASQFGSIDATSMHDGLRSEQGVRVVQRDGGNAHYDPDEEERLKKLTVAVLEEEEKKKEQEKNQAKEDIKRNTLVP